MEMRPPSSAATAASSTLAREFPVTLRTVTDRDCRRASHLRGLQLSEGRGLAWLHMLQDAHQAWTAGHRIARVKHACLVIMRMEQKQASSLQIGREGGGHPSAGSTMQGRDLFRFRLDWVTYMASNKIMAAARAIARVRAVSNAAVVA